MDPAGARELLRPPSHRGPLIAAGAVVLAVGIVLEEIRLRSSLGAGAHLAILLLCGGLIYWLGVQAPNEDGAPPAFQSVLLVTGIALLAGALLRLADVLGAHVLDAPAGMIVWTSALAGVLALWPAFARNSAICLLLATAFGATALLSAWSFVLHPGSPTPFRWLLLAVAAGCVIGSLALREPAPRHGEVLVNAAGLAIAAIGATGVVPFYLSDAVGPTPLPGFWEVVLLAFGALERSPGPAYVGVLDLLLFIAAVAISPQGTLYWWPLTLLLIGAFMLLVGLRPRRPLPPEPRAYRAGEAPLAARASDEEIVVRVRED
jgi:hypothetical protein